MDIEDLVTFEQATFLKKLGFQEECTHYYYNKHLYEYSPKDYSMYCISWDFNTKEYIDTSGYNLFENCISAPTLAQAQKWLRKNKNVSIEPRYDALQWWCNITNILTSDWKDLPDTYRSYERALSTGITEYFKEI